MKLKATISKYRVNLTNVHGQVNETQAGKENDYPETREIADSADVEFERRKFIEELASSIGGRNSYNREEAIRENKDYYYKLIVSQIKTE